MQKIMSKQKTQNGPIDRRRFIGIAAAAVAYPFIPRIVRGNHILSGVKPDSVFGGVQIGAITYSYRNLPGTSAEATLDYLLQSGLSSCELMYGPIEESVGAPAVNVMEIMAQFREQNPPEPPDSIPEGTQRRPRFQMTPEMREAITKKQEELITWRKTVSSMDKFESIRKMYNDAGVKINIVKFDTIGAEGMSAEEMVYMFSVAKTMGARGITTELNENKAKILGPLADKHKMAIGFHNHTQLKPDTYSTGPYFSFGKGIMSNLDIGHYAAGNGESALSLVEELGNQERLLTIHLKDRTFDGKTVPFGEGDAQVAEILQLIRKNKWDIPCDIELEYPVPEDSDPIKEVKKCVDFCKNVLT